MTERLSQRQTSLSLSLSLSLSAINTLTKGHSSANNNLPSELTPDVFNAHFVSVVSKFLPDDQTDGSQYNCPNRLLNFCRDRISQNTTFSIPPISVFEVGISILKLDNKKSTGCDGISVKLLKIALPYIAETLTYAYKRMFFQPHARELK